MSRALVREQLRLLTAERHSYLEHWSGSAEALQSDPHYRQLCAQSACVVLQLQTLLWGAAFFAPTLPSTTESSVASFSVVSQAGVQHSSTEANEEKGDEHQEVWV